MWRVVSCEGTPPLPRVHHAACATDTYMLVHGGEGVATTSGLLSTAKQVGSQDQGAKQAALSSVGGVSLGDNIATKIAVVLKKVCAYCDD